MEKKLLRSKKDRMVAGVCGGLGEYFNVDSSVIRLLAVLITLFGGSGILAYIILWIVIPEEGETTEKDSKEEPKKEEAKEGAVECCTGEHSGRLVFGLVLITLGGLFLFDELWRPFVKLWPLILIILGVWMLVRRSERKR